MSNVYPVLPSKLSITDLEDLEVSGVNMMDYPDFTDAYISYASYKGVALSENQLDIINEDHPEWAQEIARDTVWQE